MASRGVYPQDVELLKENLSYLREFTKGDLQINCELALLSITIINHLDDRKWSLISALHS